MASRVCTTYGALPLIMPRKVYRRRFRRFTKRRRYGSKRTIKRTRRTKLANKVHTYTIRGEAIITLVGSTSPTTGYQTFSLKDCSDYLRYSKLYDMYRIKKVIFTIEPSFNVVDPGVQPKDTFPNPTAEFANNAYGIESVIDYNGNPHLSASSSMNDYGTYRKTRLGKVHTRVLVPRIQVPVFQSTNGTTPTFSYYSSTSRWLNTTTPNVPHYGVFWKCPGFQQGNGGFNYTARWSMIVDFKQVDSSQSSNYLLEEDVGNNSATMIDGTNQGGDPIGPPIDP